MMDYFHLEAKAEKQWAVRDVKGKTWHVGFRPYIDEVLDALNKAYQLGFKQASANGER